ncbi:MAG TPA: ATP-binding protein [Gammaproteobacteria bacterium]|nr:ATP-binding protein [Gammaproteobacteria bacterium]
MLQRKTRKETAGGRAVFDLAALESSSVVTAIAVAADGGIIAANARMRRFLGLHDADVKKGKPFGAYLADAGAWTAWCEAARTSRSIELGLRGFDGVTKRFRGDVRVEGEAAEQRFVGILVDGDDSKALRAALQHSARMDALASLTAGVAHDFNNLLTVLVGNLYLIGEELRERPRVFEKLKAARDAGKRGSELIKQLMTFARREELEVGTIDPSKVIGELLPLLRRALGPRITLETTLQKHVGAVRASVAQLESVVVNLAVNSRDAIEGKGRISIDASAVEISDQVATLRALAHAGRYVAVSVRDTGMGIAPDALEHVFEPFFSTKRERGGTGLGLSMVRWFAENSGGCATIDSVVGQGTTVTLLLPRQQPDHAAETAERTMPLSTLPTGTERVVVLAMDDALRATIHQTLEVLGYEVTVARDTEDLLAAVAAKPTDLLVIDGLARGDEVLVRAHAIRPKLRIIATAHPGRAAEGVAGPDIASLAKPFTLADLAGAVRRTLDGAEAP